MLLAEFDSNKKAFLNPEDFHNKIEGMPKTCVSFFSSSLMQYIVDNFPVTEIASIKNATAKFPVYKLNINNTELAIFQSAVGAPACVSNYEELISMGIENFLLVGSCGCLIDSLNDYSIILPTSAIRDEGTSYHYAPENDETLLDTRVVKILEDTLSENKIHYTKGKTWTTDAIFRETPDKVIKRKSQGAITVEMECSAMNIVSKFRGVNFGQILYGADSLANEKYDPRSLITSCTTFDSKKKIVPLALECGINMDKILNK